MEEHNLTFLTDAKVLQVKNDEVFFTNTFINKVIIPSFPNIENILSNSAIYLSTKKIPENSMIPSLSVISAMLSIYGLEDVDEAMSLFA